MNSIFDFSRFTKLLLLDISRFKIIYSGIFLFVFTMNFLFTLLDLSMDLNIDKALFLALFYFIGFTVPFVLYGNINQRVKGLYYILRPASSFEKFLCVLVNCAIIVPVICILGYILSLVLFKIFISEYTIPDFTFSDYSIFIYHLCIGLLGNVIFYRLKFLKTIGFVTICMFFMITVALILVFNFSETYKSLLSLNHFSLETFLLSYTHTHRVWINIVKITSIVIFPWGIWVAVYLKMKGQEY